MSHTKRQYENWIMAQLDPDGIIIVGRPEHHVTAMSEKNRLIKELQDSMGNDEYRRRCKEDADKAREWYEHENNL